MTPDPFSSALCSQSVSPLDALLSGVPDGACLAIDLSPLNIGIGLAVVGIGVMALQMVVHRIFAGPPRPAAATPETGLREAGNRARAAQRFGPRRS